MSDADAELERPVEPSDVGPVEGALLELVLLEGDEEGCEWKVAT